MSKLAPKLAQYLALAILNNLPANPDNLHDRIESIANTLLTTEKNRVLELAKEMRTEARNNG